jgi:hypothetical protein
MEKEVLRVVSRFPAIQELNEKYPIILCLLRFIKLPTLVRRPLMTSHDFG